METMISLISNIQSLGWALYAGPMIAFCIMVHTNKSSIPIFMHWGVGFGLALTTWIYSSITLQYLSAGHFFPDLSQNSWMIAAFLMWVSNIKLEIWTLDPIRKNKDKTLEGQEKSIQYLKRHLIIHALLIVSVQFLKT